jgi:hypothetical protein
MRRIASIISASNAEINFGYAEVKEPAGGRSTSYILGNV